MEQERKTDVQQMEEVYRKLATPSEPHKLLKRMEGSWDTRSKGWMNPDEPPVESTGSAEMKMILGDRFLQSEVTGQMMGSPFKGIEITGFDNNTQKFTTIWLDSMSTATLVFEGVASPDGKTITQTSKYNDPIQGPIEWRAVTTVIDDNTLGFEMYSTDKTGKEQKMMEMVYSRRR